MHLLCTIRLSPFKCSIFNTSAPYLVSIRCVYCLWQVVLIRQVQVLTPNDLLKISCRSLLRYTMMAEMCEQTPTTLAPARHLQTMLLFCYGCIWSTSWISRMRHLYSEQIYRSLSVLWTFMVPLQYSGMYDGRNFSWLSPHVKSSAVRPTSLDTSVDGFILTVSIDMLFCPLRFLPQIVFICWNENSECIVYSMTFTYGYRSNLQSF